MTSHVLIYSRHGLESKYDLTTLSEVFQDPDLLSRISNETHSLLKLKERSSRVRKHHNLVTTKKPQAKDVSTKSTIAEEEFQRIKDLEQTHNNPNEYISPVASRKRRYLAIPSVSLPLHPIVSSVREEDAQAEEPIARSGTAPTTIQSNLALPSVCLNDTNTALNQEQVDKNPLEKSFEETALIYKQSSLKTVGSKYLYTFLPRQCDSNAYKYVKDDVRVFKIIFCKALT